MKRALAPLATAFALLLALAACGGTGADAPPPTPTDAVASESPVAEPSPEPEPEPEPEPTFDDNDRANVAAAVESGNTAAIQSHLSSSVMLIQAATECCGPVGPTQAIESLDYLSGAASPWDFNLDAATIDSYQAGYYSQYIPEGAFVGRSADGYVVAFTIDGDHISGIFMSVSDELLV